MIYKEELTDFLEISELFFCVGEVFGARLAEVYLFCILLWCIVSASVKAAWQGEAFLCCEGQMFFGGV